MTERLFDDHPAPVPVGLFHESVGRQLLNDRTEEVRRDGQVIEEVLLRGVFLVDLSQRILDLGVKAIVIEIARDIVEALLEPLPQIAVDTVAAVILDVLIDLLAKLFVRQLRARHADHRELARQQARTRQIVERRNQHAAGQITGSAEDHHHAGIALLADPRHGCCGLFR